MRIVGKLAIEGVNMWLTDTDGGVEGPDGSFVEMVGTKLGDACLDVVGVVGLGEEVDVQLWNEAVKLMES